LGLGWVADDTVYAAVGPAQTGLLPKLEIR
jgi:hypothetical protein